MCFSILMATNSYILVTWLIFCQTRIRIMDHLETGRHSSLCQTCCRLFVCTLELWLTGLLVCVGWYTHLYPSTVFEQQKTTSFNCPSYSVAVVYHKVRGNPSIKFNFESTNSWGKKITALSCWTTFNVYIICRYSSQGITMSLKKWMGFSIQAFSSFLKFYFERRTNG